MGFTYSTLASCKSGNMANSINNSKTNKIVLDNISNHYIFEDEVHMSFSILRKYENIIRANTVKVPLPVEFYYRPEYLSFQLYNTTDLWYLILFVNNMSNQCEFKGEEVLAVSADFLETFSTILTKEMKMQESRKEYIPVYKHMLKDLNKPSKNVLPADFDKELDDLTDLKDYEDVTDDYFDSANFIDLSTHIMRGKLVGEFYQIDERGRERIVRTALCGSYNKVDEYKDIGEDVRIVKTGYIKPYQSGKYSFKVFTDANFQLFIGNRSVINHDGDSTSINQPQTKNLFEEYSQNSDFKRRNTDFWNISQGGELIYDRYKNKNLLRVSLKSNNLLAKELFNVNIPFDKVSYENDGDIIYDIEYYLEDGQRYHKLLQEVTVTLKNNQTKKFTYESIGYTESNTEMCTARMIVPKEGFTNKDIKNVNLKLSYKSSASYINATTKLLISRIKMFNIVSKSYDFSMDLNEIQKIKSVYTKTKEHTDYFKLLYSYNGGAYQELPANLFYYKYDEKELHKNNRNILVNVYNSNNEMIDQFLSDELVINKPLSFFNLSNENKFEMYFNTEPNYFRRIVRLSGDSKYDIKLYYINNKGVETLAGGKSNSQNEKDIDLSGITSNRFKLVVTLTGTTELNYRISLQQGSLFEEVDNSKIFYAPEGKLRYSFSKNKFAIERYSGNKRSIYNMICTRKLPDDWILDFEFKHATGTQFTRRGLFGITFDMKDSESYYAIIFRCKGKNNYIQSGVYKVNKNNKDIFFDNNFKHEYLSEKMTLMQPLDIEIENKNKKIKIMKKKNLILLCQDDSRYPFQQITDMFLPYIEGLIGFMVMNQDDIKISMTLYN